MDLRKGLEKVVEKNAGYAGHAGMTNDLTLFLSRLSTILWSLLVVPGW